MNTKLAVPMFAVVAVIGVGSSVPAWAGVTKPSTLVIRHQVQGCHSWSLNGGSYKPTQSVTIHRGGSLRVRNSDVMPHKLIETSGPTVKIIRLSAGMAGAMRLNGTFPPAMMASMNSVAQVTFGKPGVYKFTTQAGEDYVSGIKTVGNDNVLKVTVTVS